MVPRDPSPPPSSCCMQSLSQDSCYSVEHLLVASSSKSFTSHLYSSLAHLVSTSHPFTFTRVLKLGPEFNRVPGLLCCKQSCRLEILNKFEDFFFPFVSMKSTSFRGPVRSCQQPLFTAVCTNWKTFSESLESCHNIHLISGMGPLSGEFFAFGLACIISVVCMQSGILLTPISVGDDLLPS